MKPSTLLTAAALAAALAAASATPATTSASSTGASSEAAISRYAIVPRLRPPIPRLPNASRVRARAQQRDVPSGALRQRRTYLRNFQRARSYYSRLKNGCRAFRIVFGYSPPGYHFRDPVERQWDEVCEAFGF